MDQYGSFMLGSFTKNCLNNSTSIFRSDLASSLRKRLPGFWRVSAAPITLWIHKQFRKIKLVIASPELPTESIRYGAYRCSEFSTQPSNSAKAECNKRCSWILALLMEFVYEKITDRSYTFLYAIICFTSQKT